VIVDPTPGNRRRSRMTRAIELLRADDGTSLVEFALVLLPVLLVVLGILWLGRALNYSSDETHLANEAARFVAVNTNPGCPGGTGCTTSQLSSWVLSQIDSTELKSSVPNSSVTQPAQVAVCFPTNPATGTSGQIGDPVEVQIRSKFQWLPIFQLGVMTSDIVGTAWMRLEQLPTNYPSPLGTCT
jgi:TadE-like protein